MTIDDLSSWLDAYGQAWETRDADAAAALFTANGTYQWEPFEEPLRGRSAIVRSWREDDPDEPGSWEARYEADLVAGDRAIAKLADKRFPEDAGSS